MMKKRVLIIDNDPVFLKQRKEWLELDDRDFEVRTADSLETGSQLMRDEYFHVVTIDVGMSDQESDRDTSGLQLVHHPDFAHIVKIVVTGPHNNSILSNDAMRRSDPDVLPPAVCYLLKSQGPEVMRDAINTAIQKDGKLNTALPVKWPSRLYAGDLAGMLEPDAPSDKLIDRGEELTDVLRKAFVKYDRVHVVRRQWHHGVLAALAVTAWRSSTTHDHLVVVGLQKAIIDLYDTYCHLMPERAPRGHAQLIRSVRPCYTLRYAGVVFELPGARLDQVRSLGEFYADSSPTDVRECVRSLLATGFKPWSQHPELLGAADHADLRLRGQAGLSGDSPAQLNGRMQEVGQAAERKNTATLRLNNGRLIIRPQQGPEYSVPDPAGWLAQLGPETFDHPLSAGETWGMSPADTIVVASGNRSWLTNYAQISHGPLLSSLAALEVTVLFELHTFQRLAMFAEAFEALLGFTELGQTLGAPSSEVRKPFAAIQQIRQRAAGAEYGGDMPTYHRALFYHATRRLLDLSDEDLREKPMTGLCLCLALGLLAQRLSTPVAPPVGDAAGLYVNEALQQAWLDGRRLEMEPACFRMLCYLWKNAGKPCSQAELVEAASGPGYSATNAQTMIYKIRKALGPAARRYLVERNGKYTLYPNGDPNARPSP